MNAHRLLFAAPLLALGACSGTESNKALAASDSSSAPPAAPAVAEARSVRYLITGMS